MATTIDALKNKGVDPHVIKFYELLDRLAVGLPADAPFWGELADVAGDLLCMRDTRAELAPALGADWTWQVDGDPPCETCEGATLPDPGDPAPVLTGKAAADFEEWRAWVASLPPTSTKGQRTMAERILITKLVRTEQTRADLYGKGHQYKDLTLFDLGELGSVGIDFDALPIGQETPCRFWAIYTESSKLNKAKRPYRDVIALEAIDRPATSTSAAASDPAILAELRAIRALLTTIAAAGGLKLPDLAALDAAEAEADPETETGDNGAGDGGQVEEPELDAAFPRYLDGAAVSDKPAEREAYAAHLAAVGKAPASVEALRAWYSKQNGKR